MAPSQDSIYRIPPFYFIHVLDLSTNVTSLEVGPKTFVRHDSQKVTFGPEKMVIVPPRHYCSISNPVRKDENGKPIVDKLGQYQLSHGDREIRLSQDPFPLYPGESISENVTRLTIVRANAALLLTALLPFSDADGIFREADDRWLFEGPGTYIPRKEVKIISEIKATIILNNQALCLKAKKDFIDKKGIKRETGETWLYKEVGAYLPGAYEEVVKTVNPYVLTDKTALHLKATQTFTDVYGTKRMNGEEWLVTIKDAETHIPDVFEAIEGVVKITALNNRQFCVILDPLNEKGKPQLGKKKLVQGDASFFLQPGEKLERGIQSIYILEEDEGLILKASEQFKDEQKLRQPGDKWMIRGPVEYVPPVEVEVIIKRKAIPLDENEGIYVRDVRTGKIKVVRGETYMLNQDESLWEKNLPPQVEELLATTKDILADRSNKDDRKDKAKELPERKKTMAVTYKVPHNAAVQIYDYKAKHSRVIYGPDLVMLGPDEQFTQLSLSGGVPKKINAIRAICLLLGPDFCTDVITVETSDHARLSLQLAYNWHFDVENKSEVESAKLFSVPNFIGDMCNAIASRVRGAVAQVPFDEFHRHSARIIRGSVFGIQNGQIGTILNFTQNNLKVTNVDIQSVEPVDQRTRDSLLKSVQLAIEITTKSQEAAARHEAERLEQEAKGRLERQKIVDESMVETSRKDLLQLQANSAAVESTGQAKAEAQSRAEALKIEGEAAVEQARLKAEATAIESTAELERLTQARNAELTYLNEENKMEVDKTKKLSDIEVNKFKDMVSSIGSETLLAMSTAGPDMQVKMLQALGLKSTLITDGTSPINLFNTASGLIGDLVPRKCED